MTVKRVAVVGISLASTVLLSACSSSFGPSPRYLPAAAPVGIEPNAIADAKSSGPVVTSLSDKGPGSLRQAVASVKSGQTITFRLGKKKRVIKLTSGAIALKTRMTITGPGASLLSISALGDSQIFMVGTRAVVTISGLTLTRGRALQGGAIYNSGKLTLHDDAFTFNVAKGSGAAPSRPLVVARTFDPRPRARHKRALRHPHAPVIPAPDSTSAGSGAAVYNAAHAALSVSTSAFKSNGAPLGGVIDNEGSASVTDATFSGNGGFEGSGSPETGAYGYGGAIYNNGKLVVTTSSFSGNVVGGKSQGSYGAGGAIAQFGGSATVNGSTFTSNVAGGGSNGSWGTGGAIYVNAGTLVLTGNAFTGNTAGGDSFGYGGAVYDDQRFVGSKDTFTGNDALATGDDSTASGGAIYAGGGLTLSIAQFSTNAAIAGSPTLEGYASGGAVDTESSATMTTVTLTNNGASGGLGGEAQGGGVYLAGGTNSTWTTVTFSTNSATATGANSYAGGGAICAFGPLTISGTSAITSNRASAGSIGAQGGGIAVEIGPFSFTGTVRANSATTQGGGLWLDDAATVANSYVIGNSVTAVQHANDGGAGIYVDINGNLSMSGSTLTQNASLGSIPDSGGGGMFNAGGAAVVNSTLTKNSSSVDGGGIENIAPGGLSITNVTVYENSAAGEGGSVKNLYSDAALRITNSIVADGKAGGAPDDVSNDGAIASGDYNIITNWSGNAMTGTTTNDIQSDPALSALANNGGPTPTNADGSSSPGTARIPFNNCLAVSVIDDQRGLPRGITHAGQCDVGAYENQTP